MNDQGLRKLEYMTLSSGEKVSPVDKNSMVKSVTFYELNFKNRITETEMEKERD